MRSAELNSIVLAIVMLTLITLINCSGEDKPTEPDNSNNQNNPPGTIELMSIDFESTLTGWDGAPLSKDETRSWEWSSTYHSSPTQVYYVTGTSTVVDLTAISTTPAHAYSGNNSLLMERQYGASSTLNAQGNYYDDDYCASISDNKWFSPARKYSLLDYSEGDSALVSLMVKPIQCIVGDHQGFFGLRVIIQGAHGTIKDLHLDSAFMISHLGLWTKISIDLSAYTGWENDIGIRFAIESIQAYNFCWQFRHGSDYVSDIHNPGDSAMTVLAIDDLKLEVIRQPAN